MLTCPSCGQTVITEDSDAVDTHVHRLLIMKLIILLVRINAFLLLVQKDLPPGPRRDRAETLHQECHVILKSHGDTT